MGVDVDDGAFCDAGGERCVCKVIDRLDGSESFGEQWDAVQVDVVGIGGRQYSRSMVMRFACSEDTG